MFFKKQIILAKDWNDLSDEYYLRKIEKQYTINMKFSILATKIKIERNDNDIIKFFFIFIMHGAELIKTHAITIFLQFR